MYQLKFYLHGKLVHPSMHIFIYTWACYCCKSYSTTKPWKASKKNHKKKIIKTSPTGNCMRGEGEPEERKTIKADSSDQSQGPEEGENIHFFLKDSYFNLNRQAWKQHSRQKMQWQKKSSHLFWLSISTSYCSCNYLTCFCTTTIYKSRFHILQNAKF